MPLKPRQPPTPKPTAKPASKPVDAVKHLLGINAKVEAQLAQKPIPVSLTSQAWNFAKATARWIMAGRPVRSPERIAEIYKTHCQPCENFVPHPKGDADKGSCGLCKCSCKVQAAVFNKIRMGTEACPMNPPKWTEELPEKTGGS